MTGGQESLERTARTGQPGQHRKERTVGQDSQNKKERTGQITSMDRIAGTGKLGQKTAVDSQDRQPE